MFTRRSRPSATGRSGGSRRKWTSSCSRGSREPTATVAGGGFDCSAMDWFAARARELGVEHAPPEPLVKGRHLLALGASPGPAARPGAARGLRASTRRTRHDVRRRARAGAGDREGEAAILKRMKQERGSRLPRCILAAIFSLVPVIISAQQQEPIAPFVVDLRGSLVRAQGRGERRFRPRRHDGQPADANARLQRRRALLPSASRRRHVRLRRSHGDHARKRDVAARRDDGHYGAVPDGGSPFPHDRSRGVVEFRPPERVELHQRRARAIGMSSSVEDLPSTDHPGRQTVHYGAGARWFINHHVALSLDFRWYPVTAQEPTATSIAQPRTTLLVFSGGIGLR